MPHVIVKFQTGPSEAQQEDLVERLAQAVKDALGSPDRAISVSVEAVPKEDWAEKVYRPDILDAADKVRRKPGYPNPFA